MTKIELSWFAQSKFKAHLIWSKTLISWESTFSNSSPQEVQVHATEVDFMSKKNPEDRNAKNQFYLFLKVFGKSKQKYK